jgi:hypothetical protein
MTRFRRLPALLTAEGARPKNWFWCGRNGAGARLAGGEADGTRDTVALTRRVINFVDRNTTELADAVYLNPVSTYTCPQQDERERELLFAAIRCSSP